MDRDLRNRPLRNEICPQAKRLWIPTGRGNDARLGPDGMVALGRLPRRH